MRGKRNNPIKNMARKVQGIPVAKSVAQHSVTKPSTNQVNSQICLEDLNNPAMLPTLIATLTPHSELFGPYQLLKARTLPEVSREFEEMVDSEILPVKDPNIKYTVMIGRPSYSPLPNNMLESLGQIEEMVSITHLNGYGPEYIEQEKEYFDAFVWNRLDDKQKAVVLLLLHGMWSGYTEDDEHVYGYDSSDGNAYSFEFKPAVWQENEYNYLMCLAAAVEELGITIEIHELY